MVAAVVLWMATPLPPGIVEPRALSWQAGAVILGQGWGLGRGWVGHRERVGVVVVRGDTPSCVRFAVARCGRAPMTSSGGGCCVRGVTGSGRGARGTPSACASWSQGGRAPVDTKSGVQGGCWIWVRGGLAGHL